MNDQKYTEKEINWALGELQKKYPKATREQAIKYLDTLKGFFSIPIKQISEDKKSGKLKPVKLKN